MLADLIELAADKLAEDVKAVSYSLEDYCKFGDELLELPFPFVGRLPRPRFTMASTETKGSRKGKALADYTTTDAGEKKGPKTMWFRYYGREAFKVIYNDVVSLQMKGNFSVYYIYGTLGFGKSHMLAALAIILLQEGRKVVYLPDCRQFARYPTEYLKDALVLTYAGDLEAQSELVQCATGQALVRWCINRAATMGEELYFLIDEVDALDADPGSLDLVSMGERQQCARLIADLERCHYLIYSSSSGYKHGSCERNGSSVLRKSFFGGLSEVQLTS